MTWGISAIQPSSATWCTAASAQVSGAVATADLLAFLESLTDRESVTYRRFSNPWAEGPNADRENAARR